jgi:hypothetical protein
VAHYSDQAMAPASNPYLVVPKNRRQNKRAEYHFRYGVEDKRINTSRGDLVESL